jgi:hypothetical protein
VFLTSARSSASTAPAILFPRQASISNSILPHVRKSSEKQTSYSDSHFGWNVHPGFGALHPFSKMYIHVGAAMHGHEFSHENRNNSLPGRSSLARSAFSTPLPRRATTYDRSSPILHRPTAAVRPVSEYTPRLGEPVVRFQEPETDTISEDGRSVANSEGSEATVGGSRRRRRSTRTSTAFHLAHPAPTLTQKQRLLQIRPRLLLQLQRLSAESRPKPAIDVLPSTFVVPRFVKNFPRIFRGKAELGANDVMVVKSEEYDKSKDHSIEDTDSDEEGLANRDLVRILRLSYSSRLSQKL